MVAAALTILRGFLSHEAPRQTEDTVGSFEEWDALVRQCVIWLGTEKIAPVADPKATMESAKKHDPARQRLSFFLRAVYAETCGKPFTCNELIEKTLGSCPKAILNILLEVATHRSSNTLNARVLGSWIGKRLNDRCDGYWLERGLYSIEGLQQWVVKREGS